MPLNLPPPVRAVRAEIAVDMRRIMERVVLEGTGRRAHVPGYTIGGKTGSAQMFIPGKGWVNRHNSSFIGFGPVNNPRIVVVVTLNNTPQQGGIAAAPVFEKIAETALRVLQVPKDDPDNDIHSVPPPPRKWTKSRRPRRAAARGSQTAPQDKAEPEVALSAGRVYVAGPRVPDFRGKPMIAVMRQSAALRHGRGAGRLGRGAGAEARAGHDPAGRGENPRRIREASMKLGQLLEGVPLVRGLSARSRRRWRSAGLEYDSRRVEAGFVFFAFPGARSDGRQFAAAALAQGAVAVACESPKPDGVEAPWIQVLHGREALARMSRAFYDRPDEALKLTGVTGTNGKTTTVYLIDAMLRASGANTGMVGTILYHVAGEERAAVNTTPESLDLMRLMAETRDRGGSYFDFEVSSHALALRRVFGLSFHTAVFTNLTRDHLDYHGTMEAYFEAKRLLFEGAGGAPPRAAVLNADNSWCARIRTRDETQRLTYSARSAAETPSADLRAMQVESGFKGVSFRVLYNGKKTRIHSPLCGLINVYNLLAAFGAGLSLGLEAQQAAEGLASLAAVPGRFEGIDEGQPFLVIVDYAHTDDALRNVILTARDVEAAAASSRCSVAAATATAPSGR